MEIWNHFTFRKDMHPLTTQYVLDNNIPYDYGETLSAVDISESDPHWEELSRILKLEHKTFLSETKFSKHELDSAEWLTVRSRWYYDYPQPETEYEEIVYHCENACLNKGCGMGLIQKDSFRFKRSPKWGRRNFCMINWVYDELFISTKAKELLESSSLNGFSFLNVNKKSGNATLDDVFQMKIPHILAAGIHDTTSRISETSVCPICKRKKLHSNGRGQFVFNKEIFYDAPDFVKSNECFGYGLIASRLIIVSQKAYKFLTANKLDSSLVFEPIVLV